MRRPAGPVTLGSGGLVLSDRTQSLISGSVHYWRMNPAFWPRALDEVRGMGLRMVCTYVPWSEHEVAPGKHEFGQDEPHLDLGRFLELCAERDLSVMLRPGPHINAELTCFGYPERILRDPRVMALTAQNTPAVIPAPPKWFPAPSFASEVLFEQTRVWFDAVAAVTRPFLATAGGPVVALQADNEASLFFRTGAFDQDYAKDAIAAFRRWLRDRYQDDLRALNRAHRTRFQGFDTAEPPRSLDAVDHIDLPRVLDWVAFKEALVLEHVDRLAAMLREAGLEGVVYTHNYPMTDGGPLDVGGLERRVDVVGIDLYHPRDQLHLARETVLHLDGVSRLPYVPEIGVGAPFYAPLLSADDCRQLLGSALAYGVRGFNLYMAVDRDRWYGAPVSERGERRPEIAGAYELLLCGLERVGWHRMERPAGVVLFDDRAQARLATATTPWDPIPTLVLRLMGLDADAVASEDSWGWDGPVGVQVGGARRRLTEALDETGLSWVHADSGTDPARLTDRHLWCVPAAGFLSAEAAQRIAEALGRGAVVIIGPELPGRTEYLEVDAWLGPLLQGPPTEEAGPLPHRWWSAGSGRVVHVPGLDVARPEPLAALLETLAGGLAGDRGLPRDPRTGAGAGVDALWHVNDGARVAGLVNRTATDREAAGELLGLDLRDLVTGERFAAGAAVPLPARSARLLEVL